MGLCGTNFIVEYEPWSRVNGVDKG